MRRIFIAVVILLLTLGQAQAVDQFYVYKSTTLNATPVILTFGINARSVTIHNYTGAVALWVDWTGSPTVTVADYEIRAASSYTTPPNLNRFGRISIACATAGPCDVQVLAVN